LVSSVELLAYAEVSLLHVIWRPAGNLCELLTLMKELSFQIKHEMNCKYPVERLGSTSDYDFLPPVK